LEEEIEKTETTAFKAKTKDQKDQSSTLKEEEDPNNPMQHQAPQLTGMEITGIKRTHGLEGSESDKDTPTKNQLSIVTTTPNTGGW